MLSCVVVRCLSSLLFVVCLFVCGDVCFTLFVVVVYLVLLLLSVVRLCLVSCLFVFVT